MRSKLKEVMDKRRISLKELSVATGLSQKTINSFRTEQAQPTVSSALKIAIAMSVPLNSLWVLSAAEVPSCTQK